MSVQMLYVATDDMSLSFTKITSPQTPEVSLNVRAREFLYMSWVCVMSFACACLYWFLQVSLLPLNVG